MNLQELATNVTIFLTPFLPYLLSGVKTSIEEIGTKFGDATWKKAEDLWNKIQNQKLSKAADLLVENPKIKDSQIDLARLLVNQLGSSEKLAAEVRKIIQDKEVIQSIRINQSKVDDVLQELSKNGVQEMFINDSQVKSMTQKQ